MSWSQVGFIACITWVITCGLIMLVREYRHRAYQRRWTVGSAPSLKDTARRGVEAVTH